MRPCCFSSICLVVCGTILSARTAIAEPQALRWEEAAGKSLALWSGNHIVWRFNYATSQNKPYFHPLAAVAGPVLTLDQPADHVWHHGLWLSWKFINGVNYWEPEKGSRKPAGRTQWSDVKIKRGDDFSARITLRLAYRPGSGEVVLREQRTIHVSPPDSDGGYHLDWSSQFTAEAERVKLDRTPLPGEPGGVAYGGYAGLSLRMTPLKELTATTPDGPVTFQAGTARLQAAAVDYSGSGDGRRSGIAILVDPRSFNVPSPWYLIASNRMTYFSPAVLCFGPHAMKRGESFSLDYRVCVHPDAWSAERLGKGYKRLVASPHSPP